MNHRTTDTDPDELDRTLAALRAELDHRARHDEAFWHRQREALHRGRRSADAGRSRPGLARPAWALAATAAALLLALGLGRWATAPPASDDPASVARSAWTTADLLRSVESTLASDAAGSLAAADLLLAELEEQYAAAAGPQ